MSAKEGEMEGSNEKEVFVYKERPKVNCDHLTGK